MIQAKKKGSLMRRRMIASILAIVAVLVLIVAMVIVQNFVKVTPWDDVDGTRYYVRQTDGVYGLYDENKVILTIESDYGYYVTQAGTLVDIDPDTGEINEIIPVDDVFSAQGNENFHKNTHRILIFPHLQEDKILSIEVHNEHGGFTFHRFDTINNRVDKNAEFVIKGSVTTTFDPELSVQLYVDAGKTISTMKLTDPIKDANGEFSEYGLVPEIRQRPKTDADGNTEKDEDGEVITEEYRYEPAYYILTDVNGNRHKLIVGDALLTGKGYYVQYVDLSGKEEVKRDAVYVLDPSLKETVLAPIEDFVTPMISYPLGMMTYADVQNFVVRKMETDRDDKGSPIYKPVVSFSFKDISERDNTIWAAYPYYFDDVDFMDEIRSMKGYTPHTNNISSALRNLYEPEFVDVIRLNPTNEELVRYGLYETLCDQAGNPILDEKGNVQYSPASQYTLAFDHTIEDEENPKLSYTHSHDILISKKNELGNYYVYTYITTTGYEKQSDGSLEKIRGYTYSYNTIVEVAGHTLDFVDWDTMKWVSKSIVQDHIAFIDRIEIESPGYSASFDLDNSESDQNSTSSDYLKVHATDSKGRDLTTFNYLRFTANGKIWYVTATDIQCFTLDSKGNEVKQELGSGSFHYEYDALGFQVLVGSNNGKIPGALAYVFANEVTTNGSSGEKNYVRYSTNLFRLLYQSFFYIEIINSYEVSAEEEKTLTDESNLILRMTVHTEDRDGTKNQNVYSFYRISSRKAYITINGNGGFYVQADRIEKILSDVEKFFNYQPIDPLAKK